MKGTHSRWYKYKALASPWPQSCHSPAHTVPWLLMAQGIKCKLPTILPLPTSPAASQLLSSSTLFFLLSGQVKLVPPRGLCTCSSLNLEESFPRFCTMGLFSSVKSWHKCHFLGEAAMTAFLKWCPHLGHSPYFITCFSSLIIPLPPVIILFIA